MEALAGWSDDIARSFREAGPDVTERSIFGGSAFFIGDAFVGLVETVAGQLRARFREELRDDVALRPHFDPTGALPTLLIITDDDRDFARGLVPRACARARRPAASRSVAPAATPAAPAAPKDAAAPRGAEAATRRRRSSR